uniref:DEAD domain-containing protein n=1 Tax=Heligmosomoides polygyrus TaxID=6339 RepID=A0A183FKN0_HELPZ
LIKTCVEKCRYTHVRPIQAAAIPLIMSGYDVMGLAETGGGKTAAFVLPILHSVRLVFAACSRTGLSDCTWFYVRLDSDDASQ